MKKIALPFIFIILFSCYASLSMDGFDKEKWLSYEEDCSTYRMDISGLVIDNQDVILKSTQNEVETLLGKASEHELYNRNQKFFHYRLTPPKSCGDYEATQYLSIRFNAIGRANLVQVMLREPS
jgi:hypothetical protein